MPAPAPGQYSVGRVGQDSIGADRLGQLCRHATREGQGHPDATRQDKARGVTANAFEAGAALLFLALLTT